MQPTLSPYFYDPNVQDYAAPSAFAKVEALLAENDDLQKKPKILPLVKVATATQAVEIPLFFANETAKTATWQLTLENGDILQGDVEVESNDAKTTLTLPADLPLGYHTLSLKTSTIEETCSLIITPEKAFQPAPLQAKQKLWGAFLQLYTLRSAQNWGVGDLGDLKQFLAQMAPLGADFVGLNPIHALFPANPDAASPYSPSSRLWQNIIYLDVNALSAFQQSTAAQRWFHSTETQQRLAELRAQHFVDYADVMALKLHALRLAFAQFASQPQAEFEAFIQQSGEALRVHATFDALHEWLSAQSGVKGGWKSWAAEYQDYRTNAVAAFQQTHADDIRFYMWLQFVAQQQLADCDVLAKNLKMSLGFYRDLAVGVTADGAETWADKALFVQAASIGAPPDMLAPNGQNWGLSPMHPRILQARGYQPFIDLVRANMQHCGALRIDHILGFARMWWVAEGESAKDGIYVRYPLEDMLAILALESQRQRCLVIAEALGTVPEGILEALEEKGIFAYNIFYFEKNESGYKPLESYPYQAMTTLSTHDLPTIQGYWKGYDFVLGEKYDTYPSKAVLRSLKADRAYDRLNIRTAVEKVMTLPPNEVGVTTQFTHQLQRYVAHTESALFGTQPEDWLNMLEPVNIPGTSSEYPNWRRKLSATTEQLFTNAEIQALLADINAIRKKANPTHKP